MLDVTKGTRLLDMQKVCRSFPKGSGEQEEVADGPLQLAGKRDIDRVTLTVGRFAVTDFFDGNSYARDPRADFMNWSIWSSGAYDFPADLPGLNEAAVAALELVARQGVPAGALMVDGGLGMIRLDR